MGLPPNAHQPSLFLHHVGLATSAHATGFRQFSSDLNISFQQVVLQKLNDYEGSLTVNRMVPIAIVPITGPFLFLR